MSRFPSTSLRSSREVRDEEEIDRGPLPEVRVLSDEEAQAIDAAMHEGKAGWHQRNDAQAAALDLQHLDAMRRVGAL